MLTPKSPILPTFDSALRKSVNCTDADDIANNITKKYNLLTHPRTALYTIEDYLAALNDDEQTQVLLAFDGGDPNCNALIKYSSNINDLLKRISNPDLKRKLQEYPRIFELRTKAAQFLGIKDTNMIFNYARNRHEPEAQIANIFPTFVGEDWFEAAESLWRH